MIPNETLQHIDTIGSSKVIGDFRITAETQARILMTLSDKIYTRKELAVIRETSTNAADAHIMVGKPIADIMVTLPTLEDLNFRIRDFGDGLTEIEIRDIFCVFGESTKRQSNAYNGVLGYGAKSPFCASDTFTVTSWCNGEKTVYQCIKGDSTKLHSSILLLRIPSDEPTGIEICVPVKQNAVYSYHREAINFYRHWPVMPTIKNLSDEDAESIAKYRSTPATLKGNGWEVRPQVDGARGTAYMGYVPYLIDWSVLYHKMSLDSKTRALFELIKSNDVTLYFEMGEVNFVDSREQLEYTDMTFNALVARITEIFGKIQDAIQEKFTDLATIWDAKIMYNAIFGTGVLEVEKGESDSGITDKIKILDGNLLQLERTFQDAFAWKGIVIRGPWFSDINRFDNDSFGTSVRIEDSDHNPNAPIMVTYRKKKSRVKSNRCTSDKCNKIVASSKVAVVINDTGRKTGQQMSAKYLIFEKGYSAVHVLTFETAELKELFYKTYDFDTVPVIKLSEIMPEAKKWNNVNKVSRNYGGGGGGVRPMQYLDLDLGEVQESEVPVREIEDGGFYVKAAPASTGRGSRRRNRETRILGENGWTSYNASELIEAFSIVCEELDLDVDRIYIINDKTSEAKWFQEATASGDWTLLWKSIRDAMPTLTMDVDLMVDAEAYENTTVVCDAAAKMLTPLILEKKSPILDLIATVSNRNYDNYIKVKDAFKEIGLWTELVGEHKGTVDFKKSKENARMCYPYLPWNNLEYENYVSEAAIKNVAVYINAMDLYVDLTRDKAPTPVQTELIAA
jgi:hypothetical protein